MNKSHLLATMLCVVAGQKAAPRLAQMPIYFGIYGITTRIRAAIDHQLRYPSLVNDTRSG